MSEGKQTELESLLLTYLEAGEAGLSNSERGMGAYMMARLIVDHVTSPGFWTEGRKKELAELIMPFVKALHKGSGGVR
jgi:hypothetical protein